MPKYFIITGLPRSRTAWMANLFCTGNVICFHEPINLFGDLVAMKNYLDGLPYEYVGISDSSIGGHCDWYLENFKDVPVVFIEREVKVVLEDFEKFMGMSAEDAKKCIDWVWEGATRLHELPNTITVPFEKLNDTATVGKMWEYCIPDIEFDIRRCSILQFMDIQQHKGKVLANINK